MDIDPALVKHWAKGAANAQPRPARNGGAARIPLTQHPVIRQQAMARFVEDEAEAQRAAVQVKPAKAPLDLRLIRWTGRLIFNLYARPRDFLVAHAGFVSIQYREFRLTACRACTFRKEIQGDGVLYCAPMLERCSCPAWLPVSLWWVTKLRKTECPLKRWDKAEAATDEAARQSKTVKRSRGCGGAHKS